MRYAPPSASLVFALLLTTTCTAATAEMSVPPRYPPYPDVWGYELPYPEAQCDDAPNQTERGSLSAYVMDDGEIVLFHSLLASERGPDGTCAKRYSVRQLNFFSGELRDVTPEYQDRFAKDNRERRVHAAPREPDELGERLRNAGYSFYKIGNEVMGLSIRGLTEDGTVTAGRSILYFPPQPVKDAITVYRDDAAPKVIDVVLPVIALGSVHAIPLADETLLLIERMGNIAIRLTSDITTRYANPRIRLVDKADLDAIRNEVQARVGYEYEGRYEREFIDEVARRFQEK